MRDLGAIWEVNCETFIYLFFPIKICLDYYLFKFVFPFFVLIDGLSLRTIEVVNLLLLKRI